MPEGVGLESCPLNVMDWVMDLFFAGSEPFELPFEARERVDRRTHYAVILIRTYEWKSEELRDHWMKRWEER
jgi:hypothetical protein